MLKTIVLALELSGLAVSLSGCAETQAVPFDRSRYVLPTDAAIPAVSPAARDAAVNGAAKAPPAVDLAPATAGSFIQPNGPRALTEEEFDKLQELLREHGHGGFAKFEEWMASRGSPSLPDVPPQTPEVPNDRLPPDIPPLVQSPPPPEPVYDLLYQVVERLDGIDKRLVAVEAKVILAKAASPATVPAPPSAVPPKATHLAYPTRTGSHWTIDGVHPSKATQPLLVTHLSNGEHRGKFDRGWLESQSRESLLGLHDDDHTGKVQWSYVVRPAKPVSTPKPAAKVYAPRASASCPTGNCPSPDRTGVRSILKSRGRL